MDQPKWYTRELALSSEGEDVEAVQVILGIPVTGRFDERTGRAVRGFQRLYGIPPTGAVGPVTAKYLGERDRKRFSGSVEVGGF